MKWKMYQRPQILLSMTPGETDHGPLFWVSTQSALLEMEAVIPTYTLLSTVVLQIKRKKRKNKNPQKLAWGNFFSRIPFL